MHIYLSHIFKSKFTIPSKHWYQVKGIDWEQTITKVIVTSSYRLSFKLSDQIASLTDKIILGQRLLGDDSTSPW